MKYLYKVYVPPGKYFLVCLNKVFFWRHQNELNKISFEFLFYVRFDAVN